MHAVYFWYFLLLFLMLRFLEYSKTLIFRLFPAKLSFSGKKGDHWFWQVNLQFHCHRGKFHCACVGSVSTLVCVSWVQVDKAINAGFELEYLLLEGGWRQWSAPSSASSSSSAAVPPVYQRPSRFSMVERFEDWFNPKVKAVYSYL